VTRGTIYPCGASSSRPASRLGNTETFLTLMMSSKSHNPDVRMIGDWFYNMIEKSHVMREFLPPAHLRNRRIRARLFNIYGA
jgi:hypothetical protein